jgi:hypothetical protein
MQRSVAFVRRYGLLWHGASDLGSGKCRESLVDWFEAIGGLCVTMGLYQSLEAAIRSGSLEPIRKLELPWPEWFVKEASYEKYLEAASLMVADLITSGLEDCRLGVVSTVGLDVEGRGPGAFRLSHSPPHLLAAAYAQLAMLVVNRAELRECPGCGRIFHPESAKQKYCTESCASTSRWRRWKERQAD